MAILITSPGLVTTGTEGADEIRFITGGALTGNASVVGGLAGNDTITTNSGVLTVSGQHRCRRFRERWRQADSVDVFVKLDPVGR